MHDFDKIGFMLSQKLGITFIVSNGLSIFFTLSMDKQIEYNYYRYNNNWTNRHTTNTEYSLGFSFGIMF